MSIRSRLKNAFDVFINGEQQYENTFPDLGPSYSYRMDRPSYSRSSVKTIITSIFNRIAIDCSLINVRHVRLDEEGRFVEELHTSLNNCFSVEANVDQTGRAFFQDAVYSLLDEGCIAIVPTYTSENQYRNTPGSYDIYALRVGKVTEWFPQHVRVNLYDVRTGQKKDLIIPKENVAIVESPLYSIINGPNSTMKRLVQKLALLDEQDLKNNSGRLDLLIHNPFLTNTEVKRKAAEVRRNDIIQQLTNSSYGIAYIDGTEKVTQLNRSVESDLPKRVEYLTSMLYSQLGMTPEILNGTAEESTMNNYYNRVCEPIMIAISEAMYRRFLTPTARTQGQSIQLYRDPLKLVPVTEIAQMADSLNRNAILTSNEIRQAMGYKPADDEGADALMNKNIKQDVPGQMEEEEYAEDEENFTEELPDDGIEVSNEELENMSNEEKAQLIEAYSGLSDEELEEALSGVDDLDAQLDELLKMLKEDELEHTGARGGSYASPYYDPDKAHEYYEAHKQLKSRTSTAGLNDKGKEAAKYVRDSLTAERKAVVDWHRGQTDEKVGESNAKRKSQSNAKREEIKGKIEESRNKKKAAVESYRNETQSKIDNIKNELKTKFSSEKYKNLPKDQKEKFKAEKAKFAAEVKSTIESLRADNKAERNRLNEEHNKAASLLNEQKKKHLAEYSSKNKEEVTGYRNEHKQFRSDAKTAYDEEYVSELEKIRADPTMLKQKKTSKKK